MEATEQNTVVEAELELGLGLSLGSAWGDTNTNTNNSYGRILTANDFPSGFPYGTKRERATTSHAIEESGSASAVLSQQIVGWPPLKACRMNNLANQSKEVGGDERKLENSNKKINHGLSDKNDVDATIKEKLGNLGFVKVNMDGVPIGRKVDLNAQKSYETLAKMLYQMFFKPSLTMLGSSGIKEKSIQLPKLFDGSSEFVLTYEDKEGDWMLVGDVPWGMFLDTVKRLRIMKTPEANCLAPKIQESNEKRKCRPI